MVIHSSSASHCRSGVGTLALSEVITMAAGEIVHNSSKRHRKTQVEIHLGCSGICCITFSTHSNSMEHSPAVLRQPLTWTQAQLQNALPSPGLSLGRASRRTVQPLRVGLVSLLVILGEYLGENIRPTVHVVGFAVSGGSIGQQVCAWHTDSAVTVGWDCTEAPHPRPAQCCAAAGQGQCWSH